MVPSVNLGFVLQCLRMRAISNIPKGTGTRALTLHILGAVVGCSPVFAFTLVVVFLLATKGDGKLDIFFSAPQSEQM